MRKLLERLTAPLSALPFAQRLPLDFRPVADKPALSLAWRFLRPWLVLRSSGQWRLQQDALPAGHKRILWIYKGSPQIGDALMDLSSRTLLKHAGYGVDLYTDSHLAALFGADAIFSAVLSDPSGIDPVRYDLAILDSFKARCVAVKIKSLRHVPFVTMRGYFSGPEFNRTLFSFFRMRQLLGQQTAAGEVDRHARPCLFGSDRDRAAIAGLHLPSGLVAFAVGGADAARTYGHWDRVIAALLDAAADVRIVLIGSANGRAARDGIMLAAGSGAERIVDCVATCSVLQTYEILKKCRLAVCCDGGLLHVAHAANLPTVSLFDGNVDPAMRLTSANVSTPLRSGGAVSELAPETVAHAVLQALSACDPTGH